MKPTGLNWIYSLSWDLLPFTPVPLWAAPPPVSLTIPCHLSVITDFGMRSDFLHYGVLPDHPVSREIWGLERGGGLWVFIQQASQRWAETEIQASWDRQELVILQCPQRGEVDKQDREWVPWWDKRTRNGEALKPRSMCKAGHRSQAPWPMLNESMRPACTSPCYCYYVPSLFTRETLTRFHRGKWRKCGLRTLC